MSIKNPEQSINFDPEQLGLIGAVLVEAFMGGELGREVVAHAFDRVLEEKSTGTANKAGRPATRLRQVKDLFLERLRESKPVSMEDLKRCFPRKSDAALRVADAIRTLNDAFEVLDEPVAIKSLTFLLHDHPRPRKGVTFYWVGVREG